MKMDFQHPTIARIVKKYSYVLKKNFHLPNIVQTDRMTLLPGFRQDHPEMSMREGPYTADRITHLPMKVAGKAMAQVRWLP